MKKIILTIITKFIKKLISIFVLYNFKFCKTMRSKALSLVLLTLIVAISTLINSCNDADKLKIDPQSGKDYVVAESAFANVFKNVSDAVQFKNLSKSAKTDTCPVITVSGTGFPKTVTIAFGDAGCEKGGVTYKGTITAIISNASFKTEGSRIDVSFDNFYINGDKIEGTKTITNLGINSDSKLMFKAEVKNAVITTSNGTIKFAATKTWTWLEGESTPWPVINDDVWLLEGYASGTNIDNMNFTASTLSPLKIKILACSNKTEIVSGTLEIKPAEGQDMKLNYGDGGCDGEATLTIAGIDTTIHF